VSRQQLLGAALGVYITLSLFYIIGSAATRETQPNIELTSVKNVTYKGSYAVEGHVVNRNPTPKEVWVRVLFLNGEGKIVDSDIVRVIPRSLEPGEEGWFFALTLENKSAAFKIDRFLVFDAVSRGT